LAKFLRAKGKERTEREKAGKKRAELEGTTTNFSLYRMNPRGGGSSKEKGRLLISGDCVVGTRRGGGKNIRGELSKKGSWTGAEP